MNSTHQITMLLEAWKQGDADALNLLAPLADRELKKIARKYMANERRNRMLPTELVNEAWLKLLSEREAVDWENRKHFYALLAWRMREILYNQAYKERNYHPTGLTDQPLSMKDQRIDFIELHLALEKLSNINKRAAQVVELRYFGGHTIEDVAASLGVGPATVERDWRFAKSWLWNELTRATETSH
jgi:RNA polymerase sigma-70 factor, ECF subfamily